MITKTPNLTRQFCWSWWLCSTPELKEVGNTKSCLNFTPNKCCSSNVFLCSQLCISFYLAGQKDLALNRTNFFFQRSHKSSSQSGAITFCLPHILPLTQDAAHEILHSAGRNRNFLTSKKINSESSELHTIFMCAVENIASCRDYVPAPPPSKSPTTWPPA